MRRAFPLPDDLASALGGCLVQAHVDADQRGFAKLHYRHGRGTGLTIAELTSFGVRSLRLQQPGSAFSLGFWLHGAVTLQSSLQPTISQSGEGLAYLMRPGQCLELISQSPSTQWLHLSLDLDNLQHYAQPLGAARIHLIDQQGRLKQQADFLVRVMQQFLIIFCTEDTDVRRSLLQALEQVLCTHVMGALVDTPGREPSSIAKHTDKKSDKAAHYVELAINYLELNYQQSLNLQAISEACGISSRTLQAAFSEHTGHSPMEALQKIRLTHLHKLIREGQSVSESCHAVGLRMSGRLSALYAERFGELPRETLMRSRRKRG